MEKQQLANYMSEAIKRIINSSLKATINNPKQTAFLLKYINSASRAEKIRKKFENQGKHIPPFLIASITSSCNLFCKGCYSRENQACVQKTNNDEMSSERWEQIFDEAKDLGISFILLAGGEPTLREDVIKIAAQKKSIVFPIFTNGTLIDEQFANFLDSNRNLIPVISLEGDIDKTDNRRGKGTFEKIINTMRLLHAKGIFYGASITVTTENIISVTDTGFINDLKDKGCKVIFYVDYVPITKGTQNLAPTRKEQTYLSEKLQELKTEFKNILFISFPGDEEGYGGCLAAGRGFFHINANGAAEPCPFSPFSDVNLKNCSLVDALYSRLFFELKNNDVLSENHVGGCVLFDKKEQIKKILDKK